MSTLSTLSTLNTLKNFISFQNFKELNGSINGIDLYKLNVEQFEEFHFFLAVEAAQDSGIS